MARGKQNPRSGLGLKIGLLTVAIGTVVGGTAAIAASSDEAPEVFEAPEGSIVRPGTEIGIDLPPIPQVNSVSISKVRPAVRTRSSR